MAMAAPLFAAKIEIDGANAMDSNLAMARDGKNIGLEVRVSLEGGAVSCNVDVRCRAEDPVVA